MARILFIEDIANQREFFAQELREDGHEVTAIGGMAGLEVAESTWPDLIVVGNNTADASVIEAQVRRLHRRFQVPLIIHTACSRQLSYSSEPPAHIVLKSSDLHWLREAITEIASGGNGAIAPGNGDA